MESYNQNRRILELPTPYQYTLGGPDFLDWMQRINDMFFYKNQSDLFNCYLTTLNKKVYISYDQESRLSINFAHFVRDNLPKNIRDKKRRSFSVY